MKWINRNSVEEIDCGIRVGIYGVLWVNEGIDLGVRMRRDIWECLFGWGL